MHIRKFDFDYSRRQFLDKTARGIGTLGVLAPLWSVAASNGDISKAYPDELMSIDMYTKGKIKTGDYIDASNVDIVQDLLDPIQYTNLKEQGRRIKIVPTTLDITEMYNQDHLEATLRNKGRAKWDDTGNLVADTGENWLGGVPFPEPGDAKEALANITMSWGRHNFSIYAIPEISLRPDGSIGYDREFIWAELQVQARADGKIFQDQAELLRLQSIWFTRPNDTKGSSFLSVWYYDQRKFPDLYGYFPAFKRVRQFPTNQRFEPVVPGMTFFLSDAWSSGDPMLTWGDYKMITRKPHLAPMSENWQGDSPNWDKKVHGGGKDLTFYETNFQLVPECVVIETKPTGYPRAPVGVKRVWIDARNNMYNSSVTFDRQGKVWKSFETGSGRQQKGSHVHKNRDGTPAWSWDYCHVHDIQSNRMTRIHHAQASPAGYKSEYDPDYDFYNKFLTTSAMARLGT
ncbi:DUF1329 domain-containing protein [Panacagrimonas sp.]|uniref:DUF1329 domain-containing protein n=1 Tax=Panacagrimonas sp. TaxID=2480088 RepID=UPI003B521451